MAIIAKQLDLGASIEQLRQEFNNLQTDVQTIQTNPTYGSTLIFEGATVDEFETTLSIQDPTSDNLIYLPNNSGTLILTTDTVTGNILTINANNTTNETVYPLFADAQTGNRPVESDSSLTYNPSTGLITTAAVTTTGDVTVGGNVIATGTVEVAGDTSAGDNAAIGYTSVEGLVLTGQGSTSDVSIKNDADLEVCVVPTGQAVLRFADSAKATFGGSDDLQIYHDGSNSIIKDNGTGNLSLRADDFQLTNSTFAENYITAANNGAVTLYHDNNARLATSAAGISVTGTAIMSGNVVIADAGNIGSASDTNAIAISSAGVVTLSAAASLITSGTTVHNEDVTFTGAGGNIVWDKSATSLEFADGVNAYWGTGRDLRLFHDGSNSYIQDTATGSLYIEGSSVAIRNTGGTEAMATFTPDGNVTLAYDNSTKFQTSSAGVSVTGSMTSSGAVNPSAANTYALGSATLEWSDLFLGDGSIIKFGNDQEVTLTHVADTGLLLNGTMQLQFNDSSQFINAPSNAILDINATDEVEVNATLMDVNANLDVSGTYTGAGLMTTGGNIVIPDAGNIGSVSDTDAISISSAGVVTMTQNLVITGDLTVNGTTTTLSSSNSVIGDSLIELNNGAGSNANDLGFIFERGSTGDNAAFIWDESADKFILGTTTATGASTGNLSITGGTLVATFEGNITGNVTGNADTATEATNVTASANNSTNETVYPIFVDGATGTQGVETDTGLNYNPSTGVLTTTSVTGNLTGNVTGNVTGDVTGNISGNAVTFTSSANNSANETVYPVFVDGTTGYQGAETDSGFTYNPSTGVITATQFTGNVTGTLTGNADTFTSTANDSTNEGVYLVFVDGQTGAQGAETDTALTYNPSSGIITSTGYTGTLQTAAQTNITSIGTLTTLTVDNVIINGATIGHTGDTDLMTLASAVLTVAGRVDVTDAIYLTGDEKELRWYNGSNYAGFAAHGSMSGNQIYKLPQADGSAGQAIATDGSGNLSFVANNVGNATSFTTAANNSTNETTYPVFVDGATGEQGPETDTALTYNPSTGLLSTAVVTTTGNINVGGALTVTGTTTLNGNLVLGDAAADTLNIGATILGASPLTFEGGTADGHETTFAITDPTADRTITFPNLTGTVSLLDATETLTNKTLTSPAITTSITHVDNVKAYYGTGNDLEIYHDGSHSHIDNATGALFIAADSLYLANGARSENFLTAANNGAVTLYFDNAVKLATVTGGISVTGDTTTSGTFLPTGAFSAGDNAVVGYAAGDGLQLSGQGSTWDVVLKDDNGTDTIGIPTGSGNLRMPDSRQLKFGTGDDLAIYHDGSNSYIDDVGTGLLHVRGSQVNINKYTGENMATFVADGAASLFYDNAIKLATTGSGGTLSGVWNVTTALIPPSSDGAVLGSADYEWSDLFLADGAIIYFGDDQEIPLTHIHNVGIRLADADKMQFGTDGDMSVYHSGSYGYITNNTGTMHIGADALNLTNYAVNETYISMVANGAVTLFHDNSAKFATSAAGVSVTGSMTSSGAVNPSAANTYALGSASLEWSDLFLGDGSIIKFGNDQEITLTHGADTGLTLAGQLLVSTATDVALGITQTTAGVNVARFTGSHASFTGNVLQPWTVRATGTAFDLIECVTNNGSVVPFRVRGDGQVTSTGGATFSGTAGVLVGTTYNGLFTGAGGTAKLAVVGESSSTSVVGNTDAAMTIANKDGTLGNTAGVHFSRADTDETPNYAGASIVAQFTATQVTGQYPPADLNFLTSPSANAAPTLKMTLSAAGNLNVTGTVTATAGATLLIKNSGGSTLKTIKGMT